MGVINLGQAKPRVWQLNLTFKPIHFLKQSQSALTKDLAHQLSSIH